MAGIFSRGFGFPSTSLAAAAEATAKGSAGSRAGAGPRPARRPPPAEEKKKKIPGLGSSQQTRERAFGVRDGAEDQSRRSAGPAWTDAAAGFHAACSRDLGVQGLFPLEILLLGTRCLDAHINLSLHLRSEEAPLEEELRGRAPLAPGGCGCERARVGASRGGRKGRAEEEGEGGRTEPKTRPPRSSCCSDLEHRSVTRDAEERRQPPKGLSRRDSHHCLKVPRTDSTLAPAGLHMLRELKGSKAVAVGRGHPDARLAGWAGLRLRTAAPLPEKAALAAGLRAGEDRLRPARLRRALTARAAPARPLVGGGPISACSSLCKGGVVSTPGPRSKLWGRSWPPSTKPAGGRSAALLLLRSSQRAETPASLKPSFEKCPFECKGPPRGPAGKSRGEVCFLFFKLFWSP